MTRKRRQPLDPGRISAAALALIDRDGLEGLSMRTLAGELGVEAMSLYHHVPNKEALLDGVMELLVAEVEFPSTGGWEERTRGVARSLRRVALHHPHAYVLLLTRPYQTTPLLAFCERLAELMAALAMDAETTARAFRLLGHFIDGATLYAAAGPARKTAPPVPPPAPLDPAQYPHLLRIAPHLARATAEGHFEFGLDRLLTDLRRLAQENHRASRS